MTLPKYVSLWQSDTKQKWGRERRLSGRQTHKVETPPDQNAPADNPPITHAYGHTPTSDSVTCVYVNRVASVQSVSVKWRRDDILPHKMITAMFFTHSPWSDSLLATGSRRYTEPVFQMCVWYAQLYVFTGQLPSSFTRCVNHRMIYCGADTFECRNSFGAQKRERCWQAARPHCKCAALTYFHKSITRYLRSVCDLYLFINVFLF